MNMQEQIKRAYGSVHAPADAVERMKQEIYQKDFHEEGDELICQAVEAPRKRVGRYFFYAAATLMLCVGCGMTIWNLRDQQSVLNPSTNVSVEESTEETTETAEPMP
jgi:hypothetical protein